MACARRATDTATAARTMDRARTTAARSPLCLTIRTPTTRVPDIGKLRIPGVKRRPVGRLFCCQRYFRASRASEMMHAERREGAVVRLVAIDGRLPEETEMQRKRG